MDRRSILVDLLFLHLEADFVLGEAVEDLFDGGLLDRVLFNGKGLLLLGEEAEELADLLLAQDLDAVEEGEVFDDGHFPEGLLHQA